MYRQLEFPEELRFKNGETVRTPGQLAALLRERVELSGEVLTMFYEGTLELWLQSTGWEELAQRVSALRKEGVSKAKILVDLNKMLSQDAVKLAKSADAPGNSQSPSGNKSSQTVQQVRPSSQLINRQRLAVKMFWKLEEDKNRRQQEIYNRYRQEEEEVNDWASEEQERIQEALYEIKTSWNIIKRKAKELGLEITDQEVSAALPEVEDAEKAFSMAVEGIRKCDQNIHACMKEIDRMRKEQKEREKKRKERIENFKPFLVWGAGLAGAILVFTILVNAYGWVKAIGISFAILICLGFAEDFFYS